MTLHALDLRSLPEGVEESLTAVFQELQGLKASVVYGGGANADLALAGIHTEDTLVAVTRVRPQSSAVDQVVAAGATATTDIAVAGLDTLDRIVSVLHYPSAGGPPTDVTGEASISSAGHIQLSTTDTTGDTLVILFQDGDTPVLIDATAHASIHATGVVRVSDATTGEALLVVWFDKNP